MLSCTGHEVLTCDLNKGSTVKARQREFHVLVAGASIRVSSQCHCVWLKMHTGAPTRDRARLASPAVQKKDGFGMIAWRMLGQHMSAPIYIDFQELFAQNIYGCSLVKGYVVH